MAFSSLWLRSGTANVKSHAARSDWGLFNPSLQMTSPPAKTSPIVCEAKPRSIGDESRPRISWPILRRKARILKDEWEEFRFGGLSRWQPRQSGFPSCRLPRGVPKVTLLLPQGHPTASPRLHLTTLSASPTRCRSLAWLCCFRGCLWRERNLIRKARCWRHCFAEPIVAVDANASPKSCHLDRPKPPGVGGTYRGPHPRMRLSWPPVSCGLPFTRRNVDLPRIHAEGALDISHIGGSLLRADASSSRRHRQVVGVTMPPARPCKRLRE